MRTRLYALRQRHNPLRRRSDVVEAWGALLVMVLLAVGAPAAGYVAGRWSYGGERAAVAERRAEVRQVAAVLVDDARVVSATAHGGPDLAHRAKARWTPPGGKERTGPVLVPPGSGRGERVQVWVDSRGRGVPAPPSGSLVWQHALTLGVFTTAGTAAAIWTGHLVVRRAAMRRRLAEWDRAWARTGPEWARRHA